MLDHADDLPLIPTETEQVQAWRLHVLLQAGYPVDIAERLASARYIDLHGAVELLKRGCRPQLVADILL